MENKYISVSSFAKKVNKPKQEIYKLLKLPEYVLYVKEIAGVKHIDISLIEILNGNIEPKIIEECEPDIIEQQDEKPQTDIKKDSGEGNNDFLSFLLEENKRLREQVENKEKVIAELTNKVIEITTQAQTIAENALITTSQAQALQAMDKQEPEKKKGFWQRLKGKKEKE